jgi:hypothetical protein
MTSSWQTHLQLLLKYKSSHGDCNVPFDFITLGPQNQEVSLGAWLSNQLSDVDQLTNMQRKELENVLGPFEDNLCNDEQGRTLHKRNADGFSDQLVYGSEIRALAFYYLDEVDDCILGFGRKKPRTKSEINDNNASSSKYDNLIYSKDNSNGVAIDRLLLPKDPNEPFESSYKIQAANLTIDRKALLSQHLLTFEYGESSTYRCSIVMFDTFICLSVKEEVIAGVAAPLYALTASSSAALRAMLREFLSER